MKKKIPVLQEAGFRLAVFDVAYFLHDMRPGRKYWSEIDKRIYTKYTGSHRKVTAHGAIYFNGDRRVVLTEGKTTSDTFIEFLKDEEMRCGKVRS